MARGQRKSVEEKIRAKQEMIDALLVRLDAEKKELDELFEEKRKVELKEVSRLMENAGISTGEMAKILQEYIGKQTA